MIENRTTRRPYALADGNSLSVERRHLPAVVWRRARELPKAPLTGHLSPATQASITDKIR